LRKKTQNRTLKQKGVTLTHGAGPEENCKKTAVATECASTKGGRTQGEGGGRIMMGNAVFPIDGQRRL